MLDMIHAALAEAPDIASVIISISVMLFFGFAMTRLTKRLHLPDVTAYIVTGILIGPYVLGLIPKSFAEGTQFLPDIALAFIAFSTGEFFRFSELRKNGAKVIVITVFEACFASVLVFCTTFFLLRMNLAFSVVLAALASATAPASTMMTIRQTGAKGDYVNTLLQVVALDDIVGLILYSVSISVALSSMGAAGGSARSIIRPIIINIGVLLLGALFAFFLKLLMPQKRSTDNRLIISIAMIFALCGVCAILDVSPLLGCMSMGMVYINLTGDDKLFKQLNYFSPPILLLFFVRSGVNFDLRALVDADNPIGGVPMLVIGVLYFIARILGKYGGAWLGCLAAGKNHKVRDFLGFALIPQAGVAIGLAALGARTLGGQTGQALETIILASSVLYELIGPACAKMGLYLSGSYSDKLEDITDVDETYKTGKPKSNVEILIERIEKIQSELPEHVGFDNENEQAFTEAAEEHRQAFTSRIRNARRRM